MTRSEITKDMKQFCGSGMIAIGQIAKYMGYKKNDSVWSIVDGLERIGNRYFVRDVADRIKDAAENNGR